MKSLLPAIILLLTIFAIGCSSTRPTGKTEAEILYNEAKELIDDSRFLLATEKLNAIRSQYPYSYYSTLAELLQADVLFAQENYVEAASQYIVFKDFHPKHKKVPYVVFRIAESFYNQRPDTYDRDLTPCHEAKKYYQEILDVYSKSEFAKGAQDKIVDCNTMIANKEKYIADFYFKTKVYDSARYRYLDILDNFTGQRLRDHSMIRVIETSKLMDKPKDCTKYYKRFKGEVSDGQKERFQDAYTDCRQLPADT